MLCFNKVILDLGYRYMIKGRTCYVNNVSTFIEMVHACPSNVEFKIESTSKNVFLDYMLAFSHLRDPVIVEFWEDVYQLSIRDWNMFRDEVIQDEFEELEMEEEEYEAYCNELDYWRKARQMGWE